MGFNFRKLNISDGAGHWLCPSCGFEDGLGGNSFDDDGPIIGTGICECCRYEPGYDDVAAASGTPYACPLDALKEYSRRWVADGMVWRGARRTKPENYDPAKQIMALRSFGPPELLE